ncbi:MULTISPECIES: hypothetical protein [Chryseobacterium]|uniref:hypothetical protein n=1 Tax=Chryseobacterium TaxID=59732 RepID=UPI00195C850C|nr:MULTISPECIES: hypothetical protein [Chryseobacterium]MBM7419017.1 hypothetical protein [Chryseobacterium sp. JUb44]MDH6208936.1 hypothetical protein [Chryseobacterium sp. BIGb0186]WSO11796.1 hypothetical protein VUJ64_07775 [Chryseobacterium scophthalmum]
MELLTYSVVITFVGSLITLYMTEKVKGKVKDSFDTKLEELKRDHSIEITRFQTEINSLKSKDNFKFTKLHEKRFSVLEESYKLLNKTVSKINQYISPAKFIPKNITPPENEDNHQKEFLEAHYNFTNHFVDNRIYFNQELESLIESYISEIGEIYDDYFQNHFLTKMETKPDREIRMKAFSAYKKVSEKLLPIKKEIEKNVRNLLEK